MRLSDIDKSAIRKYYNDIFLQNKTYSQIKNAHKIPDKFFIHMVDKEILDKNPCTSIGLSQYKAENEDFDMGDFEDFEENSKIETFTEEEI